MEGFGPPFGGEMVETIKVYKGSKDVIINKSDLEFWEGNGWLTSADRQKASKAKKAKKEEEKIDESRD